MNLNYTDWKLYLVGVVFLGVIVFLQPYLRDSERKKERDQLDKKD